MNGRISILTHTHSDCRDIWPIYSDKIQEYVPGLTHYAVSNYHIEDDSLSDQFHYDDDIAYSERLKIALNGISEKYILLMLEDYIPYAQCDLQYIQNILSKMDSNNKIGFVRLLQSGASKLCDYDDELYIINPDEYYFFSTQATIWSRQTLLDLVNSFEIKTVRHEPETSPYLKKLSVLGLCTTARGQAVGGHHDSVCMPYIATACSGGKWNLKEYPILADILVAYGIDKNSRGYLN